jgi:hypothetical protein
MQDQIMHTQKVKNHLEKSNSSARRQLVLILSSMGTMHLHLEPPLRPLCKTADAAFNLSAAGYSYHLATPVPQ